MVGPRKLCWRKHPQPFFLTLVLVNAAIFAPGTCGLVSSYAVVQFLLRKPKLEGGHVHAKI